ncbi:MAG: hypothetical protein WCX16_05995 [Candidatus Omnitrophota bacterium]|jgi:hypothetical protein
MDDHSSEASIENVLKELQQGADQAVPAKEPPASAAMDKELKNLKNVLLTADLQAGSVPVKKDNLPVDSVDSKEIVFNENFLKLERLIKDLKSRQ